MQGAMEFPAAQTFVVRALLGDSAFDGVRRPDGGESQVMDANGFPLISGRFGMGARQTMSAAQRLGTMSPIDPVKLVPFFLRCTLNWILEGKATVHNVVDRLPRTIDELGLMTVAEQINPMTGQKLTTADLKAAQKGGKLKLQ